jgi:hypothetical protein
MDLRRSSHLLTPLLVLGACSNAAAPVVDAPLRPLDAALPTDGAAADGAPADAAPALRLLVINEVAASETPDWFEVVNATTAPLALADFVFVDKAGDFAKAVPFPAMTLAPGAYYTQDVDGTTIPFKLAADEELWIYRASDHALSDGVDWAMGDSPAGASFARNPDVFGDFQRSTKPTKGKPNAF